MADIYPAAVLILRAGLDFIAILHEINWHGEQMKRTWITLFIIFLLSTASYADSGVGESVNGFLTSKPPESPVLSGPLNGLTGVSNTIILKWQPLLHTLTFNLEVSARSDFSQLVLNLKNLADTSFTLIGLEDNTLYYWRVSANNVAGTGSFSQIRTFSTKNPLAIETQSAFPKVTMLFPASPNPFNPQTQIVFHLSDQSDISLAIVNSLGQSVRTLVSGTVQAGKYRFIWDGKDDHGTIVPSAVYICVLKTGNRIFRQKMLFIR